MIKLASICFTHKNVLIKIVLCNNGEI